MKLGQILKSARLAIGRTLREVESTTGISNGYLSQLEGDTIKQPSPNHLHKLASYYRLDYGRLMELAGYVPPRPVGAVNAQEPTLTFSGMDELTEEDMKKIQAYIEDLRDARRVRPAPQTNEKHGTGKPRSG
jgi:HTH-type transcriptional regulator, competence development regulator